MRTGGKWGIDIEGRTKTRDTGNRPCPPPGVPPRHGDRVSQKHREPSRPPVARHHGASARAAQVLTLPVCPRSVATHAWVATSQRRHRWSPEQVTNAASPSTQQQSNTAL